MLRADAEGVFMEWRAPAFSLRQVTGDDGYRYSIVEAPGWSKTDAPGQPQLPFATALAVVPPTGDVTMHVRALDRTSRPLPYPVAPARAPVPIGDPPTQVEWEWTLDEDAYQETGLYPAEAVKLEEAGWMRGRRLVRLTFYPVRSNLAGGALDVTELVRVELRFESQTADAIEGKTTGENGWDPDDPFVPVLQNSVVNPAQVNRFARPRQTSSGTWITPSALLAQGDRPRYKLIVRHEGVYELTYEALAAAGVPVDTTLPTDYRMEHAGEEVTYQWEGDGDSAFEPGERVLFYARPTPTRFADYDVYWLTVGTTGTPMPVRTGDPDALPVATAWTTTIAEHDGDGQHYLARYPSDRDGDHWYWDRLYWDATTGTGEREKDFTITLVMPDLSAPNATLRVYMQGTTRSDAVNPDHRVEVGLNGSILGTAEWDGAAFHRATFSPSADLLRAGNNIVHLRLPGNGASAGVEEVWLDAVELRYGVRAASGAPVRIEGEAGRNQYEINDSDVRIYDVTSPTAAQIVTDFTVSSGSVTFGDADVRPSTYYLMPESQIAAPDEIVQALTLDEPPGGAEYLIIAHSDFINAAAPLATHRAIVDGLSVFSSTAQAIYDTYGEGREDQEAIKEYILHAYHDWLTPVEYVLLVGDGTEDPQGRLLGAAPHLNYIPPYMVTDRYGYPAPSDNQYATVDGSDKIADVFIGRLPVNTALETTDIVDKILAYELDPPQWPWNERVLFFADAPRYPPPIEDFHNDSDDILFSHLPSTFSGRRIYYCLSNCTEPYLYSDINAAHDATMRALSAGGVIASYVGHSSWHQWVQERMFHLEDVVSLRNGGALPIFLQMTCYTSDFSDPKTDNTLDEILLRQADGGAVATWGPTTEGSTDGHSYLQQGFFDAVFQDGTIELGPAIKTAKLNLPDDHSDLHNTHILFGDPAMDLNLDIVPWTDEVFLPLTIRGS